VPDDPGDLREHRAGAATAGRGSRPPRWGSRGDQRGGWVLLRGDQRPYTATGGITTAFTWFTVAYVIGWHWPGGATCAAGCSSTGYRASRTPCLNLWVGHTRSALETPGSRSPVWHRTGEGSGRAH
jgi:hypothetical protein